MRPRPSPVGKEDVVRDAIDPSGEPGVGAKPGQTPESAQERLLRQIVRKRLVTTGEAPKQPPHLRLVLTDELPKRVSIVVLDGAGDEVCIR